MLQILVPGIKKDTITQSVVVVNKPSFVEDLLLCNYIELKPFKWIELFGRESLILILQFIPSYVTSLMITGMKHWFWVSYPTQSDSNRINFVQHFVME